MAAKLPALFQSDMEFNAKYLGLQTIQNHIVRRPLLYWNGQQISEAITSPRGDYTVETGSAMELILFLEFGNSPPHYSH